MFLIDTDHVAFLQRGSGPEFKRLTLRMARCAASDFYVPIISFQEQTRGWNAYINRAKTATGVVRGYSLLLSVLRDFARWQVASFDQAAAIEFESLRQRRIRVGTMDLRIAAIALVRGYTVLSRNLVDFQKVPGLAVEDWTTP